jgi:tRNA-intron endonuclease
MIDAYFSGKSVSSNSSEAFALFEKSRFGEKVDEVIEYSLVEALFLMSEKKLTIYQNKKRLTLQEFTKKLNKLDKKVSTKFIVFKDLRKKGYIVKTALKFGAEFRVYEKGVKPGEDHARWILYTTKEHDSINWHEFAAKNRVAHSTKKNLLIAIVDEEGDVLYYDISWTNP